MSNTGVLQVRADPDLIDRAQKSAAEAGFSSAQEMIRVLLKQLADKQFSLTLSPTAKKEQFPDEYIKLGPKAAKRWEKILRDASSNKNMYSFENPDEALDFLLSADR